MKKTKIIVITVVLFLILPHCVYAQRHTETITDRDNNSYNIKTFPDSIQWLTKNLNIYTENSWCYDENPENCKQYGRLYTFESAIKACSLLGEGWRLPTNQEWESMVQLYGGVRDKSADGGKSAFKSLIKGGVSGIDIFFGGGRETDGKTYARMNAHGFYWTATENSDGTVWFYNLGANGKIVNRHEDGNKQSAVSVRCIRIGK